MRKAKTAENASLSIGSESGIQIEVPTKVGKKPRRTYGTGTVRRKHDNVWQLKYRPQWASKPQYKTVEVTAKTETASRKNAEKALSDWITELDKLDKPPVEVSIQEVHDMWLRDQKRRKRTDFAHASRRFQKHVCKYFAKKDCVALKKADIDKYIDHRLNEGDKDATINRELSALGRGLRVGFEDGIIRLLPPITKLKEDNIRDGFVERKDYLNVLRLLPRRSQMLWSFAYHWGIRKGELLKFKWSWILPYLHEDDEPIVKIPGFDGPVRITKNGKPHTAPLYTEEMRAFLQIALSKRNPKCPYLFQDEGERLTLSKARDDFENARVEAGLDGLIFHDLRRTAVREMERAGIPRHEAMQITGHLTESIYKRYDIASEKGAKETGVKLRDHHNRQAEKELVPKLVPEKRTDSPFSPGQLQ